MGDYFGVSVELSGDLLAVSSRRGGGYDKTGSAYVFRYDGSSWSQQAKFVASDAEARRRARRPRRRKCQCINHTVAQSWTHRLIYAQADADAAPDVSAYAWTYEQAHGRADGRAYARFDAADVAYVAPATAPLTRVRTGDSSH